MRGVIPPLAAVSSCRVLCHLLWDKILSFSLQLRGNYVYHLLHCARTVFRIILTATLTIWVL
jgi:hypothetical protein